MNSAGKTYTQAYNLNSTSSVEIKLTARMLSPDPFVQNASSTQNYNRYSYCMNNPLKYTDPSGYYYLADLTWVEIDPELIDQSNNAFISGGDFDGISSVIKNRLGWLSSYLGEDPEKTINLKPVEITAKRIIRRSGMINFYDPTGDYYDALLSEEDKITLQKSIELYADPKIKIQGYSKITIKNPLGKKEIIFNFYSKVQLAVVNHYKGILELTTTTDGTMVGIKNNVTVSSGVSFDGKNYLVSISSQITDNTSYGVDFTIDKSLANDAAQAVGIVILMFACPEYAIPRYALIRL